MISKIIQDLSNNKKSLVKPLLATKILASRLENNELLDWVNHELDGYNNEPDEVLPNYRIAKANSSCSLIIGTSTNIKSMIPISLFPLEYAKKMFLEFNLLDGVEALEEYSKLPKSNILIKPMGPDFWAFLTAEIQKKERNIAILDVQISTPIFSIVQTLSEIRSNFLNFMLALERKFPDIKELNLTRSTNKEEINEQITIIMKQINIKSPNKSTISIGNENNVQASFGDSSSNTISNSDFIPELKALLNRISEAVEKQEINEGEDINIEVQRINNQLKKSTPLNSIIKQSLGTIHSLFTSIAANALTSDVLIGIQKVLALIG